MLWKKLSDRGYIGKKILGSDYSLHMHLHSSAGRYMCGEETGLLNALEGKTRHAAGQAALSAKLRPLGQADRGQQCGNRGQRAWNRYPWSRLVQESQHRRPRRHKTLRRKRPCASTRPFGNCPWAHRFAKSLKNMPAVCSQATNFAACCRAARRPIFSPAIISDTPMDFESVQQAGSRLGTGTMIVLDDRTCPLAMVKNLMDFFRPRVVWMVYALS